MVVMKIIHFKLVSILNVPKDNLLVKIFDASIISNVVMVC